MADSRTITLCGEVTNTSVYSIVEKIIKFNEEDENIIPSRRTPISLFLNTPGGSVYNALALIDATIISRTPVHTYALGMCFSAGFLILISGSKRVVSKNSFVLLHPSKMGTSGTAMDIRNSLDQLEQIDEIGNSIIIEKTKITREQIDKNNRAKTDWNINSKECLELGIADEILSQFPQNS